MNDNVSISTNRVVLVIGIGTCLSLLGDTSMYTVLPTHTLEAGVTLASVGILLSANRFIRLLLNGPAGIAFERWSHRGLFVAALYLGACSTALYGLTTGFWPLLAARVLWGISWVGIWIGGNTICLSVTNDNNRGRWIGLYYLSFFLGAASGGMLGGLLTDQFGYHTSMIISASLTFLGATVALIFLPETYALDNSTRSATPNMDQDPSQSSPKARAELIAATVLLGLNRLAFPGFLLPTFGLLMFGQLGDPVLIAGRTIGVTTLTGLGLGLSTLVSMISAPIAGGISDRIHSRWRTVAGSFIPGILGFTLLSIGKPFTILFGVPLSAITSGSNTSLSTSLIGDISVVQHRSRRLGIMFTVGDLMSAIGPPLAYALIPYLGVRRLYSILAGLFSVMLFVAVILGSKQRESQPSIAD
jgi:MFS family permease